MAEKKYYWLKLKRDFFKRHDIRIIESMPNGKDYILFYLKLLLESIDHEGTLRFSDAVPYNENMLSVVTNTNIDIVRAAMKMFLELNMMEIFDDQTIYMTEVEKLIGSESASAARMRRHRYRELVSHCDGDVTKSDAEIDKEKEIDLDLDSEKETEGVPDTNVGNKPPVRHKYGPYKNVLLSDQDYAKLVDEFPKDYQSRIDRLSEYMKSTGKKYADHLATIRTWAKKDKQKQDQKPKQSSNPFLSMLHEEGDADV